MSSRDKFPIGKALFAILTVLLLARDALAYVGPTPGPEFVGYFASLLTWLVVVFSALLLWPIHALRQRFWRRKEPVELPAVPADALTTSTDTPPPG